MSQVIQVNGDYSIKAGIGKTITFDTGPNSGLVLITGDLRVDGETTSINTTDLFIEDNIIVLNNGEIGPGITKQTAGIKIDRGSALDVRLLFDESLSWYNPRTEENNLGAWVLNDTGNNLKAIRVASISSDSSTDIVFDLRNTANVLSVANSDPSAYSFNILGNSPSDIDASDNKIPNVRTMRNYVSAGIIEPGMADVDKIYFSDTIDSETGLPIVDTRIQSFKSTLDFFIDELLELEITNSGLIVTKDLAVNGGDITTDQATFNLLNTVATTVNFAGAATTVSIGAETGTTSVNNNLVVDDDLAVNGGDITTDQATFNLLNTVATTVNFAGFATAIDIGANTGTTNVNNNLNVVGDVSIDGGDLISSTTTFNLLNTVATTVNFAGFATAIDIGANTGTTTVKNNLVVNLDLEINGSDITTDQTTFNLLNTTATTVNFAGDATTVNIGTANGSTNLNDINISGNIISNISGNDILIDGVLSLSNQTTVPDVPTGYVKVYSTDVPGGGGTGLYFVNTIGTNDELISRSKAFIYSLIL